MESGEDGRRQSERACASRDKAQERPRLHAKLPYLPLPAHPPAGFVAEF